MVWHDEPEIEALQRLVVEVKYGNMYSVQMMSLRLLVLDCGKTLGECGGISHGVLDLRWEMYLSSNFGTMCSVGISLEDSFLAIV